MSCFKLIFLVILNAFIEGDLVIAKNNQGFMEYEDDGKFKFSLSTIYLPYLASTERHVYEIIKNFSKQNEDKVIQKYILDYEESGLNLTSDWDQALDFTKNPLSIFRMIRRFVKEYKGVENTLKMTNANDILGELNKLKEITHGFPELEDFSDCYYILLTLHDYHDLKANELARGKLLQPETGVKLKPRHCFEIAKFAMKSGFYTLSWDWLDAAEDMIKNKNLARDDLNEKEIQTLRHTIIQNHDNNWEEYMKYDNHFIFNKKLNTTAISFVKKRGMKKSLWGKYVGNLTNEVGVQMHLNFIALCKGTKFMTPQQEKQLHCWLDTKRAAYWIINPLKIELVNKVPYVILIHNAVPDSWTNNLIQTAFKNKTTDYAYLDPENFPNIPIEKRSDFLFNLITEKNSFRINTYAPGALLAPHIDTYGNSDPIDWTKDQLMASTVFYLNEVEKGGETVFPYLGLSVKGPKGSVLMWYTTQSNGEWDKRMYHGGCPILYGHKWVASAWILTNRNFLQRPCLLDQNQ